MRILFFLLISSSLLMAADQPSLSESQQSKLADGQIVMMPARDNCPFTKGGKYVSGIMFVKHEPAKVWTVLNDHSSAPNYLQDLVGAKVLSNDSQSVQVEQSMKVVGFSNPFKYTLRIYPKQTKQTFVLESGKLKALDGAWWSFSVEGGTLMVYSLFLDPGSIAPQFVVRRSLAKKIPETLAAVRGEVNRRS